MSKLRELVGIASLISGTTRESISRVEELDCSVDPEPIQHSEEDALPSSISPEGSSPPTN
jgi:hypothetical protein